MSTLPGDGRINLEYLRKQAKQLLRAAKAQNSAAAERFARWHPQMAPNESVSVPTSLLRLSESQLVIARSLGFSSWAQLKHRADELEATAQALADAGDSYALDDEVETLHVRCGDDLRDGLALAGLRGRFETFTDPLCQGPVVDDAQYLDRRVSFITKSYHANEKDVRSRLTREYQMLTAASSVPRVVLWFEHDSYDQLILARLLAHFAEKPPAQLELVCTDLVPGVERLHGLGQLAPEVLQLLWQKRRPVTQAQLKQGAGIWGALCEPDPQSLKELLANGLSALPEAAGAIHRHLQELPDQRGLSLTQRLILEELNDGPLTGGKLFRAYGQVEPLTYLGDTMFWHEVENLALAASPAIRIANGDPWPTREVSLTDRGAEILSGNAHWLSCGPAPRWVGGVRVDPAVPE